MFRILPLLYCLAYYCKVDAFAVDFAREVLPILSNKCFACHGPDTKEEKLVRLDLEDLAKKDLGGYHAIDPANLEDSELLYRIDNKETSMGP